MSYPNETLLLIAECKESLLKIITECDLVKHQPNQSGSLEFSNKIKLLSEDAKHKLNILTTMIENDSADILTLVEQKEPA